MKTRRSVAISLVVLAVMINLPGCKGKATQDAQTPVAAPTELTFLIKAYNDEVPAYQAMVESFNTLNKDIHINLTHATGAWAELAQKLTANIAAGTPPDLSNMGVAYVPSFAASDQLLDLTDRIAKDLKKEDYNQNVFEAMKQNGRIYGVPSAVYTLMAFYNKEMFDEAGIPYPGTDWNNSWTMEEFLAAARKLTSGEGPNKKYGFYGQLTVERTIPFILSNGGNILSKDRKTSLMDQKPVIDTYAMIQTLIREGVMPTPESIKAMPYEQMFLSGRLGILLLGQWGVITYTSEADLKTGIAPVPRGAAGAKTTLFIDEFVSFKNAAHPEESWRALKFFIGKEGTGIMAERNTLGVPAYKPVAEGMKDKIYSGLTRPEVASVFQSLDFAEAFPFTVEYLQMIQAHNVQIDLIGLDKISAEEGVKKIHAEWTNIMNQP